MSLSFSSGAVLYTPGQPGRILKESISGELQGGELRLIYVREGHAGVPVSATRARKASAPN